MSLAEAKELLPERMGVTDEERHELRPAAGSGATTTKLVGRAYLTKAKLIRAVKRGVYELTDTGRQLMASQPQVVTVETLLAFEPFRSWREDYKGPPQAPASGTVPPHTETATPEEVISAAHAQLRQALALELAEALQTVTW